MNTHPVFADAGPGPFLIPILGGLGVAGLFLAAAFVTGGLWLAHGSAAPKARKWFLISTAVGCLGAASIMALLGQPRLFEYWIGAALLSVVGVIAVLKLRAPAPLPPQDPDSPVY